MSIETGLTLFAILLLLGLSAFFTGSETALTAASRPRMRTLAGQGKRRALAVEALLAEPERLAGAVLLGRTLADLLAAALAAGLALRLLGGWGVLLAAGVMTVLIVAFSAVVPKSIALARPDRVALGTAPLMQVLARLLTPVVIAMRTVVGLILKLTPSRRDDEAGILAAHEELRGAIELQRKEGVVAKGEAQMLGGILDLPELQVLDIMVHRTKMETISADDPPEKVIATALQSQYSRLPVWKEEPDNIVGVLHTRNLLAGLANAGWNPARVDIQALTGEPWFVPDATSVKDQLNGFLRRKAQLALVVDEYGEVQGLVTLEDILEEIVGQIADEHDTLEQPIRQQADGSVTVDGGIAIRDLNRHMDWSLPDEDASTIAGLVIHEAQSIPEPGQAFTFHGFRFEILRRARNRITSVRIRPLGARTPRGRPGPGPAAT